MDVKNHIFVLQSKMPHFCNKKMTLVKFKVKDKVWDEFWDVSKLFCMWVTKNDHFLKKVSGGPLSDEKWLLSQEGGLGAPVSGEKWSLSATEDTTQEDQFSRYIHDSAWFYWFEWSVPCLLMFLLGFLIFQGIFMTSRKSYGYQGIFMVLQCFLSVVLGFLLVLIHYSPIIDP